MITPPVTLITHGIVAVAAAAGAYQWQAHRYEAKLATIQTEYAQAQHRAVENAHAETIRLQARKDEAEVQAARRVRAAAADAAVLRGGLDGLRGDLANGATGSGKDTGAATTDNAAAARAVSAECADALAAMAGHADGWRNEAVTLREAWPMQE